MNVLYDGTLILAEYCCGTDLGMLRRRRAILNSTFPLPRRLPRLWSERLRLHPHAADDPGRRLMPAGNRTGSLTVRRSDTLLF